MKQAESAPIVAYKGFEPDLTCRGFQYAEGETYEHDGSVELCRSGFHAVTQPIHVLQYYSPARSVYHVVRLEDVAAENEGDSKVAARKITVGAKISLAGLIEAQVRYVTERAKPVKGSTTKAVNGAATASGESGAATASGRYGAATASGDYGAATASGESGAATASGGESVAIVTGREGKASGALGCWIVLTERDANWHIVEVRAVRVDGKTVKANTFYRLAGGNLVEVQP